MLGNVCKAGLLLLFDINLHLCLQYERTIPISPSFIPFFAWLAAKEPESRDAGCEDRV